MCGLTGFWSSEPLGEGARELVRHMALTMRERGPDSEGVWLDRPAGIALAHRRLAILDLSAEGHQPMISPSGRYVIAYNGEVYNYRELRKQIDEVNPGIPWRGGSDTEVMLAAIDTWGLERALHRLIGMFAFALWDREERVLKLVRDRLGIKPLVYARAGDQVVFGSTLAPVRAHPQFDAEIDRNALAAYFRFSYVPAPHTIHAHAKKVRPGTIVTFRASDEHDGTPVTYWSTEEVWRQATPFDGDEQDAVEHLEATLRDAIRLRLVADVPVGAFLSGGIDSSTVVALMQEESARPIRTYSIGNERADYDEGAAATAIAKHLGTDHTTHTVTVADAVELLPDLPGMYDEPFADSSQVPTLLVSRIARRDVAVALSGDGGDELFGGYTRHVWGPRVWQILRAIPRSLRNVVAQIIMAQDAEALNANLAPIAGALGVRQLGDKLHKLARALPAADADELYKQLQSHWDEPSHLVLGADREARRPSLMGPPANLVSRMMLGDLVGYLPDDVLTKVDRATMATSLEARVPILDHRVVSLAARFSPSQNVKGGIGKQLLRSVLARHVPRHLWERPKMGFGFPLADWLRGPLRPWAEEILAEPRLARHAMLDSRAVHAKWRAFVDKGQGTAYQLWIVLMFEAWYSATQTPHRTNLESCVEAS